MVEERAARSQGSTVNLRVLALELQRAIQNYVIALLAMIRDNDAENVAMIRAALRPIDALREQLERERGRGRSEEPSEDEETQPDIDELFAEEQAIAEELSGNKPAPKPDSE